MRLSDVILILGPIVLLAFALGVVNEAFLRIIVITAVVAGGGYWFATRLAGKQKRSGRSRKDRRDGDEPDEK